MVLTESTDTWATHAVWHVLLSILAVSIIHIVHNDRSLQDKGFGAAAGGGEITDVSPQNPVVARVLLGSVAMLGLPTLMISLLIDWWAVGYWRWPMVCKPTQQRPGGYFVVIGALPTLVAQAFAFWLIASTASGASCDTEEIVLSKQVGCSIGHISVVFGFLSIAIPDGRFPTLHTLSVIMFLCLMMVATLLTTLSARDPLAPGKRGRFFLMVAIFASVLGFLVLLILVDQYTPNSYNIPHPYLATSEYIALALPMFWPLTWKPEVQARWQTHKVWRNFENQVT
jgi:hypothetical protein